MSRVAAEKRHRVLRDSFNSQDGADKADSLFRGDSEILSDAGIARILDFKLHLPVRNRLAVLRLGTKRYWSEEHAEMDQASLADFLDRLRSAKRICIAQEPRMRCCPESTLFLRIQRGTHLAPSRKPEARLCASGLPRLLYT